MSKKERVDVWTIVFFIYLMSAIVLFLLISEMADFTITLRALISFYIIGAIGWAIYRWSWETEKRRGKK